jgi:hypothetical protein
MLATVVALINKVRLRSLAVREGGRSVEEEAGGAGSRRGDGALYACGFGFGFRAGARTRSFL